MPPTGSQHYLCLLMLAMLEPCHGQGCRVSANYTVVQAKLVEGSACGWLAGALGPSSKVPKSQSPKTFLSDVVDLSQSWARVTSEFQVQVQVQESGRELVHSHSHSHAHAHTLTNCSCM